MSCMQVIALCLLAILVGSATSLDCSNVLSVVDTGSKYSKSYVANVSFRAPRTVKGNWAMDLTTDQEFAFLMGGENWVMVSPDNREATIKSNEAVNVELGDLIKLRFSVSWFPGEPKPKIISMVWQGWQVCNNETLPASQNQQTRNE